MLTLHPTPSTVMSTLSLHQHQPHHHHHHHNKHTPHPPTAHGESVWEAVNLLRNLETYGASTDEELGELIAWFLQAEYGNAHECQWDKHEIRQYVKEVMAIHRVPPVAFEYWNDYVGTLQTTALTLFVAGVNRRFHDKQDMGVFFF